MAVEIARDYGHILFLSVFIIILLLTSTFISKLIKLYKAIDRDDDLIKIISKTTILVIISGIFTFSVPVSWFVADAINGGNGAFIYQFMTMIDVLTNFLCVLLLYKYFDKLYYIFCGCLDKQCIKCWNKIINQNQHNLNLHIKDFKKTTDKKKEEDKQLDGTVIITSN